MHNFNMLVRTIKQVRLGQRFSKVNFGTLILITLVALVFGVLIATKSCDAPTSKPETNQGP